MNDILTEKQAYNALAISVAGDFRRLQKIKSSHENWVTALSKSKSDVILDPDKAWQDMRSLGIDLILKNESSFPQLLKEIPQCPEGIYYKGDLQSATSPAIAIVGTRKATPSGLSIAKSISTELSKVGISIISGLALGIDAVAHNGALIAGGKTVAVLARGLDNFYPAQNIALAEFILKNNGAVISEYPTSTQPLAHRFIERNRLISGLANAVIIIEAPEESGALATARFAMEQNRDVGAIPGPVNHPNYKGNHSLIRSGAALIRDASDIFDILNLDQLPLKIIKSSELNERETTIVNILKSYSEPISVDKIIETGKLEPHTTQRILTLLEMRDIIREVGGRYELK